MPNAPTDRRSLLLIVVAALGYFVDIYDLVLFNVVKRESLQAILGPDHPRLTEIGIDLFNVQMLGMLVGGILWGVWGDRKGRITVLFGSILLYSAANIINAFTFDVVTYGIVRFIAGVGLAGELGAGITLITETMSREKRGYGTMVVVVFGALGAVFADEVYAQGQRIGGMLTSLTGHAFMNWQVAYIVGGAMGLLLLVLRVGAFESGLFARMKERTERRGDLTLLFGDRERFLKYLGCILIGVPVWYVIGVLVNLSQDVFVPQLGIDISGLTEAERLRINGKAIRYAYIGLSVGDLLSALLSQVFRSRKKVILGYLLANATLAGVFLFGMEGLSIDTYNWMCLLLGTATGYWVLFVTLASEQFGTNIRSTVASATVVGLLCFGAAIWALTRVHETFGRDMDYVES